MFNNKEFKKHALPVLLLSLVFMYFYAGLQNDNLNVITPHLQDTYGWTTGQITLPVTVGGIISIFFFIITNTAFIKIGIRKYVIPISFLIVISVWGIACSDGNYIIYFVSLLVLRSIVGTWQLMGMTLCTNWFAKYRGRAIGVIACGPPLFSATGTAIFTMGVESVLGFKGTYLCVGAVLLIFVIAFILTVRDNPEDVGLYPDGTEVTSSQSGGESMGIGIKELLSYKETILIIIDICVVQAITVCYMAFFVTNLKSYGVAQATYLPALTIGALCAFPVGFIVGIISDKIGPNIAYIVVLALGFIAPMIYIFTDCNNIVLCVLIAFSGGSFGGGGGVLISPLVTHYFGRARYNAVNRVVSTSFALVAAFSTYYMSFFIERNMLRVGFAIIAVLIIIAAICSVILQLAGKVRYTD